MRLEIGKSIVLWYWMVIYDGKNLSFWKRFNAGGGGEISKILNLQSLPRKLILIIKYYFFGILKFINLLFSGIWNFGYSKIRFFKFRE